MLSKMRIVALAALLAGTASNVAAIIQPYFVAQSYVNSPVVRPGGAVSITTELLVMDPRVMNPIEVTHTRGANSATFNSAKIFPNSFSPKLRANVTGSTVLYRINTNQVQANKTTYKIVSKWRAPNVASGTIIDWDSRVDGFPIADVKVLVQAK